MQIPPAGNESRHTSGSSQDRGSRQFQLARFVLASTAILASWLLMQVVHETGHVLAAVLTGANVTKVVLVPWELSRTELLQNPRPLVVCWAGPIFGATFPVLIWLLAMVRRNSAAYWLRFFAGFCLIANGAYIGTGSFTRDGDAGDLLRYGAQVWTLWLFGMVTVPAGFRLWHGLGSDFGFGNAPSSMSTRAALGSLLVLITTVLVEVVFATIFG